MQGRDTDPDVVESLRVAIRNTREVRVQRQRSRHASWPLPRRPS